MLHGVSGPRPSLLDRALQHDGALDPDSRLPIGARTRAHCDAPTNSAIWPYLASSRPYFLMTCGQTSQGKSRNSRFDSSASFDAALCTLRSWSMSNLASMSTNEQIRCRLPMCSCTPLTYTHSAESISRKSLLRQTKSLLCGVLASEHHDRFLATGMFGQKGGHVQHLS